MNGRTYIYIELKKDSKMTVKFVYIELKKESKLAVKFVNIELSMNNE